MYPPGHLIIKSSQSLKNAVLQIVYKLQSIMNKGFIIKYTKSTTMQCIFLVTFLFSFSWVSGIFGQKLEETVRYERRFGIKLAPMLVEQCVDFIRQWGLREEGLFRLPGQANLVKELQDAFDCGEKPSFDW